MKLKVIEDCWSIYAGAVVSKELPPAARDFVRSAFYAGVAFMYDTLLANCDDESTGASMLASVSAELDEQARVLAESIGVDIAAVRQAIADEIKRKSGRGVQG